MLRCEAMGMTQMLRIIHHDALTGITAGRASMLQSDRRRP
ncbi:hypothetical protein BIWAKO_06270 [Bosea sp. BIWAKO-01]|nr:hypothetical protein BIWAKO_06270 [Bosea sp. BIWAKO-01]